MEVNIKNAFKEVIKFSCAPCIETYHVITEMNHKLCLQMIRFLLKRPVLTTAIFSVFIILFIIILTTVFITLVGVLLIVFVIALFEVFIVIVAVIVFSMIMATVTLIVMMIVGIKYEISIIHNFD